MAVQPQDPEGGVLLAGPAMEAQPLGGFTCPLCLENSRLKAQRLLAITALKFSSYPRSGRTWIPVPNTIITSYKVSRPPPKMRYFSQGMSQTVILFLVLTVLRILIKKDL
uniref:Uncharacterized protein n=1 Tax=Balaenoptera musculus TaxID=9771 RepID=A0A8C0DQG6_BALMU